MFKSKKPGYYGNTRGRFKSSDKGWKKDGLGNRVSTGTSIENISAFLKAGREFN